MAYRFVASSSSRVLYGIGPLSGWTPGPFTFAFLVKRANTTAAHSWLGIFSAPGSSSKMHAMSLTSGNGDRLTRLNEAWTSGVSPQAWSTTAWTLLVITSAGAGSPVRFHRNEGAGWTHGNANNGNLLWADIATLLSNDQIAVSPPAGWGGEYLDADVVCAGIKKGDSSDSQIETLSVNYFTKWQAFGFDWLTKFDTIGTRTNLSNPGSGDETLRTSVSLVADPTGWDWVAPEAIWSPVLDNFNRADENPLTKSGEWSPGQAFTFGSDTLKVVSNRATPNSTFGFRSWATPIDGTVFAKLAGVVTGAQLFLFQRNLTPGAGATGSYMLYLRWNPSASNHYLQLGRTSGNGITFLEPAGGGDGPVSSVFSGEVWGLRVFNVDAATVRVQAWRGSSTGAMVLQRTLDDTSAGRIMTPGYGGIGLGTTGNDLDDFGGSVIASSFVPRVMSIY
jgi:hypothetical protein